MNKTCFIIAGPNGAGKTTFAKAFLPNEGQCIHYINADLIAAGLSPFSPEKAKIKAGKLMLQELQHCVNASQTFAFETTLSGTNYIPKIHQWKKLGYKTILYYFSLPSVEIAINRVENRIKQGGHAIPEVDIRRRYVRSLQNFTKSYQPIVDSWKIIDTSSSQPYLIQQSYS